MSASEQSIPPEGGNAAFPATHWTLIRSVQSGSEEERKQAHEELCRTYWYPIYLFARRRGLGVEDAEDAVQDFFARVMEKNTFAAADRAKGRLRTWLLTQLTGCLADRARSLGRMKRGGHLAIVSFDALVAEDRYQHEQDTADTPDMAFERACARALADEVLGELRGEYHARSQADRFEALRPFLLGDCSESYRPSLCQQLGLKDGALRVALHRLREAFASRLRERLKTMVETPADLEAEVAAVVEAISR